MQFMGMRLLLSDTGELIAYAKLEFTLISLPVSTLSSVFLLSLTGGWTNNLQPGSASTGTKIHVDMDSKGRLEDEEKKIKVKQNSDMN
ncbi:hypothetical protein OUZ56_031869 [Daphnia magna]|uniref:Uncharacterized protein n=1 Tax=Daphnia magna TaxID=35525 RepID=A0ABQ9ZVG5_9CRUS|nr:hypothetical protein OUZ56_031869 [Daphnia magna]